VRALSRHVVTIPSSTQVLSDCEEPGRGVRARYSARSSSMMEKQVTPIRGRGGASTFLLRALFFSTYVAGPQRTNRSEPGATQFSLLNTAKEKDKSQWGANALETRGTLSLGLFSGEPHCTRLRLMGEGERDLGISALTPYHRSRSRTRIKCSPTTSKSHPESSQLV